MASVIVDENPRINKGDVEMKDVNKNKIGAADGGFPERASVAVGG